MEKRENTATRKIINVCLGVTLGCGFIAAVIGPCWVALLGIITATASAAALLELNGNNVTTY